MILYSLHCFLFTAQISVNPGAHREHRRSSLRDQQRLSAEEPSPEDQKSAVPWSSLSFYRLGKDQALR